MPVLSNHGISMEIDFLLSAPGAAAGSGLGFGQRGAGFLFLTLTTHVRRDLSLGAGGMSLIAIVPSGMKCC
jgi:hypothetical protein